MSHALCLSPTTPCPRQGVIVYGPPEDLDGCVNRAMRCTKCPAQGVESRAKQAEPALPLFEDVA